MNTPQHVTSVAHLVLLSAAVFSLGARTSTSIKIDALVPAWEGAQTQLALCQQQPPEDQGYLANLAWILQEQDSAALIPYDAPPCAP